jgi:hypothetical protein
MSYVAYGKRKAAAARRSVNAPRYHQGQSVLMVRDGYPVVIYTIKASQKEPDSWSYQLLDQNGEVYERGEWTSQEFLLEIESSD